MAIISFIILVNYNRNLEGGLLQLIKHWKEYMIVAFIRDIRKLVLQVCDILEDFILLIVSSLPLVVFRQEFKPFLKLDLV